MVSPNRTMMAPKPFLLKVYSLIISELFRVLTGDVVLEFVARSEKSMNCNFFGRFNHVIKYSIINNLAVPIKRHERLSLYSRYIFVLIKSSKVL